MATVMCPRCGKDCKWQEVKGKPHRVEARCSCFNGKAFLERDKPEAASHTTITPVVEEEE